MKKTNIDNFTILRTESHSESYKNISSYSQTPGCKRNVFKSLLNLQENMLLLADSEWKLIKVFTNAIQLDTHIQH